MNSLKSTKQIILSHTLTYFNFLNLALAGLVILSGQYKNMLFMGVVIANSLIGIVQELRVKKVIDRLSVITATKSGWGTNSTLLPVTRSQQTAPFSLLTDWRSMNPCLPANPFR